ncbi:MAG: PAS domain-containing protein [Proteobacteria bacterium]|nr:PAS domain-containing protein [Pseudomonadota bacterium]
METTIVEMPGPIIAFVATVVLLFTLSQWRLWFMKQRYTAKSSFVKEKVNGGNLIRLETLYGALEEKEQELNDERQKLNGIIKSITDHMTMMDEDYNIVWANDTVRSLFGCDIVGKKCFEIYHERNEHCECCAVREVFKDGKRHESLVDVVKNGVEMSFWCVSNVAARHEDGRPRLVVEVSRDVTKQKRTSTFNLDDLVEAQK